MKKEYYYYCTYEVTNRLGITKSFYCLNTFSPVFPFAKIINILTTMFAGMSVLIEDWKSLSKEEFDEVAKVCPHLAPDTVISLPFPT